MLDKLADTLFVMVVRHYVNQAADQHGLLAALADPLSTQPVNERSYSADVLAALSAAGIGNAQLAARIDASETKAQLDRNSAAALKRLIAKVPAAKAFSSGKSPPRFS